jgi:hypothetical protein
MGKMGIQGIFEIFFIIFTINSIRIYTNVKQMVGGIWWSAFAGAGGRMSGLRRSP